VAPHTSPQRQFPCFDRSLRARRPLRTLAGIALVVLLLAAYAGLAARGDSFTRSSPASQPDAVREAGRPAAEGGSGPIECAWTPGFEGRGLDESVWALAVYDDGTGPALYAGGEFITAGGVVANRIAKWDGVTWSALSGPTDVGIGGGGTFVSVLALAVYDDGGGPALYAGGSLTTAGGVTVNNVARWDGNAWSALSGASGTGTDASVSALVVYDDGTGPALYVGGDFTAAGGVLANGIAKWDGGAWSALSGPAGTGVDGQVGALAVYDDGGGPALYAGGGFLTAGGVLVNHIASWDGSTWSALSGPSGTGLNTPGVLALAVYDDGGGPALYVGGHSFFLAGGVFASSIAKWDGNAWSALSGPSGNGTGGAPVRTLAVYDDGGGPALYAGGAFTTAGGVTVNRVAKWDGGAWSALSGPHGIGANAQVFALAVHDDGEGAALYAGGEFTTAGGQVANEIAKWNGSVWSELNEISGGGVDGGIALVAALAVYDDGSGPALYAGGLFRRAGGVEVNRVARWDGEAWTPLSGPAGTGMNSTVAALTVFDDGQPHRALGRQRLVGARRTRGHGHRRRHLLTGCP